MQVVFCRIDSRIGWYKANDIAFENCSKTMSFDVLGEICFLGCVLF